jgi:hypothetical protein
MGAGSGVERGQAELDELMADQIHTLPIMADGFRAPKCTLDGSCRSALEGRQEGVAGGLISPEQRRQGRRKILENHLDVRVFDAVR